MIRKQKVTRFLANNSVPAAAGLFTFSSNSIFFQKAVRIKRITADVCVILGTNLPMPLDYLFLQLQNSPATNGWFFGEFDGENPGGVIPVSTTIQDLLVLRNMNPNAGNNSWHMDREFDLVLDAFALPSPGSNIRFVYNGHTPSAAGGTFINQVNVYWEYI